MAGKMELYTLIDEGLAQVKEGRVKPMKGTIKSIREKIKLYENNKEKSIINSLEKTNKKHGAILKRLGE